MALLLYNVHDRYYFFSLSLSLSLSLFLLLSLFLSLSLSFSLSPSSPLTLPPDPSFHLIFPVSLPPSLLVSRGCYLGIYALLGATRIIFILLNTFVLAIAGVRASRTLHARMLKNILRSPMSFFDTTPLGRVLNRFSKDIYVIDELVPRILSSFIATLFTVISTLLVIIIVTPIFAVVIVPLGIFYFLVQVSSCDLFYFYLTLLLFFGMMFSLSLSPTSAFLRGHIPSTEATRICH